MQLRIREDDSGWEMIYKQTRTMRWEAGLNAGGGVYTWQPQISYDLEKNDTDGKRKLLPVPDQNGVVEGGTKL